MIPDHFQKIPFFFFLFLLSHFILTFITPGVDDTCLIIMMPGVLVKHNFLYLILWSGTPFCQNQWKEDPRRGKGRFLVDPSLPESAQSSLTGFVERWDSSDLDHPLLCFITFSSNRGFPPPGAHLLGKPRKESGGGNPWLGGEYRLSVLATSFPPPFFSLHLLSDFGMSGLCPGFPVWYVSQKSLWDHLEILPNV